MGRLKIELPMEDIIKDYLGGMSYIELADKYFVHENTIYNNLKTSGITLKNNIQNLTAAPLTEIVKLYQVDKLNTREIASIYKCSHRAISDYLKKHNVALRTRHEGRSIYYQKRKSKGVNAIS